MQENRNLTLCECSRCIGPTRCRCVMCHLLLASVVPLSSLSWLIQVVSSPAWGLLSLRCVAHHCAHPGSTPRAVASRNTSFAAICGAFPGVDGVVVVVYRCEGDGCGVDVLMNMRTRCDAFAFDRFDDNDVQYFLLTRARHGCIVKLNSIFLSKPASCKFNKG